MEFHSTKSDLLKSLSWTQTVVDRKATMPILANCCLAAEGKLLTLTATDLEVGVTVAQPVETKVAGKVTVGARALYDIVKSLPDDRVHLKVGENHRVEVKAGKSQFKIVGLAADEYPALPQTPSAEKVSMAASAMLEMIEKTVYAMSTDETRYNLNGLFMEQVADAGAKGAARLRVAATDGHRLSYADRLVAGKWKLPAGVIVPRKGILEWRRLLEGASGDFILRLDEKYIAVERDNVSLLIRLIDGQFPPYSQVIPKDHKWLVTVPRDEFGAALRRVQLVTSERIRGVKFRFSPGHLDISAQNPDLGEAYEELQVGYKGETFEVGFNARYFQDVLNVVTDEQLVLELKGELAPCVIRSEFDRDFLSVIMPMRLS
ncbi:MAG: DNA polymerase III subunit beta [Deltaproteobacteria bacterium]|nr:DNA polymerase III subunit beta [Deltaproteobacteria bacterium]